MPLTLEATPGVDDANAYATVAEADTYASYRVGGAAFIALTEDQKIQALVTAAIDIDTLEDNPGFIGIRTWEEQSLAWPRNDEEELPVNLVNANIELAMSYAGAIAAGTDVFSVTVGNGNVKRKKVDVLETEYFEPTVPTVDDVLSRFPLIVQNLLYGLLAWPALENSWGSAVVSRGT